MTVAHLFMMKTYSASIHKQGVTDTFSDPAIHKFITKCTRSLLKTDMHRRTGPVSFGGGGGRGHLPEYFLQPENQVVLPEYYLLFLPENGHLKKIWGRGLSLLASYAYADMAWDEKFWLDI